MDLKTPLGEHSSYPTAFDVNLLVSIPRLSLRNTAGLEASPGLDTIVCYELSWLTASSWPKVAVLEYSVPSTSPKLIESKSLKLFLGSLNNEKFSSSEAVLTLLKETLGAAYGAPLDSLKLHSPESWAQLKTFEPIGRCLDDFADQLAPSGEPVIHQESAEEVVEEHLYTNLFRSICPVTRQPDWATLEILYCGPRLDERSLLSYLVSFRTKSGFHETCCEQVLDKLWGLGEFYSLAVRAAFNRRGGIDINPLRYRGHYSGAAHKRRPRQ